jgi:hypothetical protein
VHLSARRDLVQTAGRQTACEHPERRCGGKNIYRSLTQGFHRKAACDWINVPTRPYGSQPNVATKLAPVPTDAIPPRAITMAMQSAPISFDYSFYSAGWN